MNDKIRLLLGIECVGGGALKYVYDLAVFLDKSQFDIYLVVSQNFHDSYIIDFIRRLTSEGVVVHVISIQHDISYKDLMTILEIVKIIRRYNINIVHAHSTKAGFVFRVAALLCGVKSLYTPHCYYFQAIKGIKRIVNIQYERIMSLLTSRTILSVNEYHTAIKNHIAATSKFTIINNAINPNDYMQMKTSQAREKLGLPVGNIIVGGIGRLVPQKNWIDFIRIAAILIKKFPHLYFVIAGDGSQKKYLELLINEYRLKNRVILCGHIHDVSLFYSSIDIFLSTSKWEGLPYTYLEAVLFQIPMFVLETEYITKCFMGLKVFPSIYSMERELEQKINSLYHRVNSDQWHGFSYSNDFGIFISSHEACYKSVLNH